MPRKEQKFKLTKITDITPSVRELFLKPLDSAGLEFKAGQFVMLHLPQADGKPAMRAYSVASAPGEKNDVKLVIKHYDLGVASAWVRTLKGGEEITYTGPFGKFLFHEPPAEQVVFVCTSTGIAPFYSMLAGHGTKAPNVDYKVLMGVWNEKEIFYDKELAALQKTLPKLKVDFVLDQPESPDWKGLKGRVTEPIDKLDIKRPTEFYLCGNPAMIKSVKELLLGKGFPPDKIYTESYG
jgi:CDP-4-dehydro-6-deoxyglucose reductase